jgi:ketol-acid reductoisomerase
MARMKFGNEWENVVTRKEFPLARARKVLKKETVAVLGYGVQGPAQALNMRDNGINVIIGQWPGDKPYWKKAVADGWVPGKTLFSLEEATERGTVIQFLISDAGQMAQWPSMASRSSTRNKPVWFRKGTST